MPTDSEQVSHEDSGTAFHAHHSWSANWCEVEFIRLPCGVNACSVASEAVFSIPSGGEEHTRSLRGEVSG